MLKSMWNSNYTQISNYLIRDPQITGNQLKIYLNLLSYCYGDKETCFPSLNTLVSNTGISKPTIIKDLKKLEENGYLKIDARTKTSSSGIEYSDSNLYTLTIPDHIRIKMLENQKSLLDKEIQSTQYGSKEILPPVEEGSKENILGDGKETLQQVVKNFNSNHSKNNNTNLNKTTTTADVPEIQECEVVVDDTKKLSLYYKSKIGKALNKTQLQMLLQYLTKLPAVLIMEAIDRTALNATSNPIGFIQVVLDTWITNDIHSIDSLNAYESAWKQSKTGAKTENANKNVKNRFMNFKQQEYDWDAIKKMEMERAIQRIKDAGINT